MRINYQKLYSIVFILFLATKLLNAQVTISGFVTDAENGEVLIGAYVQDAISGKVVSTNVNGYFSLSANNKCHLVFSYIGYQKYSVPLMVTKDTLLAIKLISGAELSEVVVNAVKRTHFNVSEMSIKELESIPSITGKPDVMKAMQLMPGIQSQNEGSSLLIVRGGDPGQNLYLLDNTPLIYVNHLGGFMSVFNPEMMNSISVLKGGFPAEYGGKLSSIVNVTQRNGNSSGRKGTFGIGLTDINASIEGPIGKKITYIVTGRKTLFDVLLYAVTSISDGNSNTLSYGFHDINGKLTWQLNKKNKLSFNFYQGDDYLNNRSSGDEFTGNSQNTHFKNIWGNWLVSTNWNYVVSPKLFSEITLSYTRYRLKQKQDVSGTPTSDFSDKFIASVDDFSFRNKWTFRFKPWWNLNFGLNSSYIVHTPYRYEISGTKNENEKEQINTMQNAVFVGNEFKPTKRLSFIAGIRAVNYSNKGLSEFSFEPRLNFSYKISDYLSANVSYMQVKQYSHLLFTAGNIANNEVWIPATKEIKPANSEQLSTGLIANFLNNEWTIGLSGYYKTLSNLSTYKEGEIDLKGNLNWVTKIETGGKGLSYGVEFFAKKNLGNWKGSLSYTWSNTTRTYPGINNGKTYSFEYNRPHSISLNLSRKLGEKWDFSLVWVYQTGLPYTPVIGRQYTPGIELNEQQAQFYYEALIYGERNSAKMADYHRLDIGFNYRKLNKRGNSVVWNFSVYNLYNRQNPNYYYYNAYDGGDEHHPESGNGFMPVNKYQMSLFPILPSISYKVYFDGKNRGKNNLKKRFRGLLYHE